MSYKWSINEAFIMEYEHISFCYGMLFVMFFGVCNFEAWMTVDSINNIPAAVDSVGVTYSISGHYVIHRSLSKPTYGTSESDISQDTSIWKVVT